METVLGSCGRRNSLDSLIILAANEVNGSTTSRQSCRDFNKLYDDGIIYDNLKKAILVCDHMDNGSTRNELKYLIEQSIQLFKMYHYADRDSRQLSPLSPESPTSSMNPQLGIAEEVKSIGPQAEQERFIVPEMSMISLDTEENIDTRQSCLNLTPLRRFGVQLSQMLCSLGPYGRAAETTTVVAAVPSYDSPMSPSLQYFISQQREPPPTLPLDKFGFDEICRSTDADCDDNEVRSWTADEIVVKTSNQDLNVVASAEVSRIGYHERPTEPRHLQRSQEVAKQSIVKSHFSLRLKNASRENKILLLETATVIGLSLCKAFLIWRNMMLLFRKSPESSLIRPPTDEIASKRRRHRTSSLQDPTLAISTGLKSLDSRRCDDANEGNSGYDCDSNNSSNCDSASYISHEITNCERAIIGIASDEDQLGYRYQIDDANDALLLANRHSEDVAKSKSSRRNRSKLASARMHCDSDVNSSSKVPSSLDSINSLNLDKGALSGTQRPWLNCLNSTDDKEIKGSEVSTTGTLYRFEYDEVYGHKGEQQNHGCKATNEQQRSRSQTLVSDCVAPVNLNLESNSDSDSDVELESRRNARSRCFQMSSSSFEESNPLSKLHRAERKTRSVSFDGGCLPIPQMFERRSRSQSVLQPYQDKSSRNSADILEATVQIHSDHEDRSQFSSSIKCKSQPLNNEVLDGVKDKDSIQPSVASTPYSVDKAFDYKRCIGFTSSTSTDRFLSGESPNTPKSTSDSSGELQLRDCFGNAREALVLRSILPARQEEYNAIAPIIRSNELAMWAIFAQFPMTCCDVRLEMTSSALAVHNYSSSRPLLSFACLRSLLSSFGVCPAICSESELSEHLKEIKVATSPPSSPFFAASPIKVCSFESFVKILWLVASERMLMTAARAPDGEPSILQSQVRFAMLLHQMDVSDGRAKLTQCLMSSSNKWGGSKDLNPEGECLSPLSPVCKAFMEPVLPLPAFDLSVLKVARVGMAARKMMVYDTAYKAKIKKKMVVKSAADEKALRFAREVTSGIATENSSEDLSDF